MKKRRLSFATDQILKQPLNMVKHIWQTGRIHMFGYKQTRRKLVLEERFCLIRLMGQFCVLN